MTHESMSLEYEPASVTSVLARRHQNEVTEWRLDVEAKLKAQKDLRREVLRVPCLLDGGI